VNWCVAGINLDNVMNKEQTHRVQHINALRGVVCQDERKHRKMP